MSIDEAQQKDFIWTWKSNGRGAKVSLWLPYFSSVEKMPRTKGWVISYNGGKIYVELSKVDFVMFYGATGDLPLAFLDDMSQHGIVFMLHRTHQTQPYVFYPAGYADSNDVLTKQIVIREHAQKAAYVAKCLIKGRFDRMLDTIAISSSEMMALRSCTTVTKVRQIEAHVTAKYWTAWFRKLDTEGGRRDDGALQTALDAGSKFFSGILLRWILLHKLSPCHGFLHEPTGYPALIYDLMEPYRYIVEDAVAEAWMEVGNDQKKLIAQALTQIKIKLNEVVYVPATRQYVRRKNLLHGVVLALRSYLLGESQRFVIPVEGEKAGGRPPKVAYKLPGGTYKEAGK